MKKITLTICLVFITISSHSFPRPLWKQNHSINKLLNEIVAFSDFKTAGFAFYAVDLNSGETIARVNPYMALRPASTQKLLTTATILELLGPEYQFNTTLEYTGEIDTVNNFLDGNIIIRGGGDPTLGSKYFYSESENQFLYDWAKTIKDLGIDSIAGSIIADARIFSRDIVPPTWSWLNIGNYYGAGACGLTVFDNRVTTDSILTEIEIGIQKPATTMRLFHQEGESGKMSGKTFYSMFSPKLADIITQTNTHSINLFAEHCLIHSGIKLGGVPETGSSVDSVLSFWTNKGMDTQGLSLFDGSGLSQYNAITPHQMVFLLKYMKLESNYFDNFYNSMAIAGETGTLKDMFMGSIAEGKLRAKSGTISRCKAYAGYVTSKSGREIAFSMVVNNFSCNSSTAREKLEQLMIALAEFNK